MRSLRIRESLDQEFWQDYTELWYNSMDKSPFQAPGLLQFFSQSCRKDIVAIQLVKNNKLIGAVILKKEKGVYSFLSDLKTDANFFVFHNECSEEDFYFYFNAFLEKIEDLGWALILNNIPSWSNYISYFESCGSKSNLFWQHINYSVCPVLESDTPENLLKTVNRSHKYRHSVNRISNQLGAQFEVLTDDEDLENWVKEFCSSHIKRWENTSTPSAFRNESRQSFLLECLKAWCKDNILVRFAVKVKQQRIGFVIGLKEQNSLIHHSTTFHPDFKKFSPANALVRTMAEWMVKNQLTLLDFGDGDEKYKYFFANKEHVLSRILVSKKTNVKFILRAKLIKVIRKNSGAYNFYRNKIKVFLKR
jgi:hypothetical protein